VQRYWYLEYRQPYGIEQANGVLLHYTADIKNGGWSKCDYGGPDCPEDWVVNPKGGTAKDALVPAGTMWTTPEGVTVNIVSLGATAKFDLTFPKAGAAPFCDLANTPWDSKAPSCTAGPAIDGGAPPDSGTGGTGGTGGMDGGKSGAAGSAGTSGAGGAAGSAPPPVDAGNDAAGGKGGTGGMAGASGSGGAAGTTGGKGGAAGVGGTAGLAGSGGSAGATGGGSGASGSGGATGGTGGGSGGSGGSGATGGSTGGDTPPPSDDGCSCRVPGRTASTSRAAPLGLIAAVGAFARRRRRKHLS
jgi:MYXO-CTERM domain-containing protein